MYCYMPNTGRFDKFVEANGKFKETLSSDIKGLLRIPEYQFPEIRKTGSDWLV